MSYSSFPPPISSSPPPFDITGLSEKLPPTPKGSPAKSAVPNFPPEASATIQHQPFPVDEAEQPPPYLQHNAAAAPADDDDDEFGDFSNFESGSQDQNYVGFEKELVFEDSASNDQETAPQELCVSQIISNANFFFKEYDTSKDSLVDSSSQSNFSSSANVTHVAAFDNPAEYRRNSPTIVTDRHRQILNDEHYASDVEEEECLNIQQSSTLCDTKEIVNKPTNNSIISPISNRTEKVVEANVSTYSDDDFNTSTEKIGEEKDDFAEFESGFSKSIELSVGKENFVSVDNIPQSSGESSDLRNETNIIEDTVDESSSSSIDVKTEDAAQECDDSFTDFGAFAEFESAPVSEVPSFNPTFETSTFNERVMEPGENCHQSLPGEPTAAAAANVIADDVVMSCSLPTIEGLTDVSPVDDDFGYQDIDTGEDGETDDDSIGNKIASTKQVSMIEATNKLVKGGDSVKEYESSNAQEQSEEDDDDDDFDDFVTSADAPNTESSNGAEFNEFASAKIDDAFGEFATEASAELGKSSDFAEDDFGEFGSFNSSNTTTTTTAAGAEDAVRLAPLPGLNRGTSVDSSVGRADDNNDSIADPLYNRLESLVRLWLSEAVKAEKQLSSCGSAALLRDVVGGDAFVWRKLECVEWHNVSWQSSVAHQLMLTSIKMDARNILYSQKWSSSVPLFAQSLSFSPLTPAKSNRSSSHGHHSLAATSSIQSSSNLPSNTGSSIAQTGIRAAPSSLSQSGQSSKGTRQDGSCQVSNASSASLQQKSAAVSAVPTVAKKSPRLNAADLANLDSLEQLGITRDQVLRATTKQQHHVSHMAV
uniref:Aftiphilin-like n=1 Tax=Hirondellea gigas TaxID=1518452 RepID=A0A6A7G546_9CRUS